MNQSTVVVGYIKWDGYVRGSIDLFGIFSNLINILVFLSPRLKDTSYKLMLVKAISNLVYFLIAFETEILTFCVNCAWSSSYAAGFNYCYVYIYFSSCLHLLTIAIDVVLSVYTYCILINKPWLGRFTFLWISIALFAVSLAFYAQKPLVFAIYPIGNTGNFYYTYSAFGASTTNKTLQIVQSFTRVFLAIVVVTVINVFNVVKFSKRYKGKIFALKTTGHSNHHSVHTKHTNFDLKKSIPNHEIEGGFSDAKKRVASISHNNKNSQSMTRNITRMVIFSLFINVFGELPFGIVFTINFSGVSNPDLTMASQIANILILLPASLELIVYYRFNKLFKDAIDDFLKRVRRFFFHV